MNTGITLVSNIFSAFLHVNTIPLSMYSKSYLCYSKKYKKLVPFKLNRTPKGKVFETEKSVIFYVNRNENICCIVKDFTFKHKIKKRQKENNSLIEYDSILNHTGFYEKKFISISIKCDNETFDTIKQFKDGGGYFYSGEITEEILKEIRKH